MGGARSTIRDGSRVWRCIEESERVLSQADRIRQPLRRKVQIANRKLGTIEEINDAGDVAIRMDSGREVRFNVDEHPHLDYRYAVTNHSSQGQTAAQSGVNMQNSSL